MSWINAVWTVTVPKDLVDEGVHEAIVAAAGDNAVVTYAEETVEGEK